MVEVTTSQRPLSNHPGELPKYITELLGMFARKAMWMRCSEMKSSWSQTSMHVKKYTFLPSLPTFHESRHLECFLHVCFCMVTVEPFELDSSQLVSITKANNKMKNQTTSARWKIFPVGEDSCNFVHCMVCTLRFSPLAWDPKSFFQYNYKIWTGPLLAYIDFFSFQHCNNGLLKRHFTFIMLWEDDIFELLSDLTVN